MPLAPRPGQYARVAVELCCLACGWIESRLVIDMQHVPQLWQLPRCNRCGGSLFVENVKHVLVADPAYRPRMYDQPVKRGRPPGTKNKVCA